MGVDAMRESGRSAGEACSKADHSEEPRNQGSSMPSHCVVRCNYGVGSKASMVLWVYYYGSCSCMRRQTYLKRRRMGKPRRGKGIGLDPLQHRRGASAANSEKKKIIFVFLLCREQGGQLQRPPAQDPLPGRLCTCTALHVLCK